MRAEMHTRCVKQLRLIIEDSSINDGEGNIFTIPSRRI